MRKEILTNKQIELLLFIKLFKKDYYLAGGTAIALHIGHRRSIDFDLFSFNPIKRRMIKNKLIESGLEFQLRYEDSDQLHFAVNGVKLTFFHYPFKISHENIFEDKLNLPDLLNLAAMKAYAFGMRAKWKDYVDMYFLLQDHFQLQDICEKAASIYKNAFSKKLFRQQICFFSDIDYSEQPEYLVEPVLASEIRNFLINIATSPIK